MSRGWAKASACHLQITLSCAVLCHNRVAPVFVQVVSPPLGWSPLSSFLVIITVCNLTKKVAFKTVCHLKYIIQIINKFVQDIFMLETVSPVIYIKSFDIPQAIRGVAMACLLGCWTRDSSVLSRSSHQAWFAFEV